MSRKLMGKKLGMTHVFDNDGKVIPCTAILVQPNIVTQVKTIESDGYQAIQIAYKKKRNKNVKKPIQGHLKRAGVEEGFLKFSEFRVDDVAGYELGQPLDLSIFSEMKYVDIIGTSKGKGYQGVMKLHGFRGGPGAHGSGFHRHAGSTGMRSTPGRCLPGGKRASRMGGDRITVQNLQIVELLPEEQVILVKGQIPGAKGSIVFLQESVKKNKAKK